MSFTPAGQPYAAASTAAASTAAASVDQVVINSTDAARYIETMCTDLREIAHKANLAFLSYLLDVALEEATKQANPSTVRQVYGEVRPDNAPPGAV